MALYLGKQNHHIPSLFLYFLLQIVQFLPFKAFHNNKDSQDPKFSELCAHCNPAHIRNWRRKQDSGFPSRHWVGITQDLWPEVRMTSEVRFKSILANYHDGEKPQPESQDLYIHLEMKPGLNHKTSSNRQIIQEIALTIIYYILYDASQN